MENELDPFYAAIVARHPDLADAAFRPLPGGWHSRAFAVDDRLVFKFPQGEEAERALRREATILAALRPHLAMRVPDLRLYDGTPLFSEHAIIPGEHLETAHYDALPEPARQALGEALARFYADLHARDRASMERAGAQPIERWLDADAIKSRALPLLPAAPASLRGRNDCRLARPAAGSLWQHLRFLRWARLEHGLRPCGRHAQRYL
jgi:hypothetical protein